MKRLLLTLCAMPVLAMAQPDTALLSTLIGGVEPDSVAESMVPGLYEVTLGGQVVYIDESGRYMIQGDVLDLEQRVNLTEARRDTLRGERIADVTDIQTVVFGPEDAAHTVSIFTDIDCGYCRKLHQEIEDYVEQGIRVRYLAFPRAGAGSDSFNKAVSVWCAEDQQTAMTRAKNGQSIESLNCPNPVQAQYDLGQALGVRGTPSIILEDGRMVPGYVPAARLLTMIENEG